MGVNAQHTGASCQSGSAEWHEMHNHAEKYFGQALEADPEYTPALIRLGLVWMEQDQLDKACEILERAAAQDTGHQEIAVKALATCRSRVKWSKTILAAHGAIATPATKTAAQERVMQLQQICNALDDLQLVLRTEDLVAPLAIDDDFYDDLDAA
eukprot:TRINITY_DN2960_c0_g1_i4.p2 TRINITY_DN2960_c0_g1~~TRINITY_DN2960_c0_g1_i4.p2  ORF type:complete len:155 (-),score=49.37 TRINITY_DN2960_c0_g1_i4:73-537(-)